MNFNAKASAKPYQPEAEDDKNGHGIEHHKIKRIAGELGICITTVSKVLNNREDIGHATRARVLAKVAELGYQPNAVARSLTLRRTHTLGVVIPDLMHSFFIEIVAASRRSPARTDTDCCCAVLPTKIPSRSAPRSTSCASARSTGSSSRPSMPPAIRTA